MEKLRLGTMQCHDGGNRSQIFHQERERQTERRRNKTRNGRHRWTEISSNVPTHTHKKKRKNKEKEASVWMNHLYRLTANQVPERGNNLPPPHSASPPLSQSGNTHSGETVSLWREVDVFGTHRTEPLLKFVSSILSLSRSSAAQHTQDLK